MGYGSRFTIERVYGAWRRQTKRAWMFSGNYAVYKDIPDKATAESVSTDAAGAPEIKLAAAPAMVEARARMLMQLTDGGLTGDYVVSQVLFGNG
jgi:hypothetical protein